MTFLQNPEESKTGLDVCRRLCLSAVRPGTLRGLALVARLQRKRSYSARLARISPNGISVSTESNFYGELSVQDSHVLTPKVESKINRY